MSLINDIENKTIKKEVLKFLETYGFKGLQQAMDYYVNMQQTLRFQGFTGIQIF